MFFARQLLLWILVSTCSLTGVSHAQLLTDLPKAAQGIDVVDRVGEFIPLDAIFTDENGNKIGLGKFFKNDKPIILTLNYSDCPGLCIAQLDNLTNLLREINGGGIGEKFEIVTISIDPNELPEKAAKTKAKYTGLLQGTGAEEGWHFLTGKQAEIKRVANAVGFKYTYDKINKRYNHPAATFFVSENGRICRYLLSLGVEPSQFELALLDAREGILAPSITDAIIQFCYLYNPEANRYSADARRIMAFGGAAFAMLLTGFTAPFWFTRKKQTAAEESTAQADGTSADATSQVDGPALEEDSRQHS